MVADYPSAYRGHPALPVLATIPTTWDDTRCLAGKVGELIVIARRHGDEWWVGAMGGRDAREVEVPLGFLGPGRFRAEIYRDDPGAAFRMAPGTKAVAGADVLRAGLAPAGGCSSASRPRKTARGDIRGQEPIRSGRIRLSARLRSRAGQAAGPDADPTDPNGVRRKARPTSPAGITSVVTTGPARSEAGRGRLAEASTLALE